MMKNRKSFKKYRTFSIQMCFIPLLQSIFTQLFHNRGLQWSHSASETGKDNCWNYIKLAKKTYATQLSFRGSFYCPEECCAHRRSFVIQWSETTVLGQWCGGDSSSDYISTQNMHITKIHRHSERVCVCVCTWISFWCCAYFSWAVCSFLAKCIACRNFPIVGLHLCCGNLCICARCISWTRDVEKKISNRMTVNLCECVNTMVQEQMRWWRVHCSGNGFTALIHIAHRDFLSLSLSRSCIHTDSFRFVSFGCLFVCSFDCCVFVNAAATIT